MTGNIVSLNRKFVPVGTIPSNQIKLLSFSIRQMWTDSWIRRKKHSAAPPGIEHGSSDCRSDALTTELRSHDRNCVRIFCLSPNCQFFLTTRWPECLSLQTRRDQRNSLDLIIIVHWIENSFLSGPFHQIKSNFFLFLSDKCELTAGSDEKNTAQPRRGSNTGLPIAGRTL